LHDAQEPLGRFAVVLAPPAVALALALAALPAPAQVNVVVTTPDLKSITEAVSGGAAKVQSLIPAGADPEAFEPRPAHLVALREAALVVRVGAGYEHWLDRLIQQAAKPHLRAGAEGYLDASAGIALLEQRGRSVTITPGHAHGSANPHYWLDPANGRRIAQAIQQKLAQLSPGDASYFAARYGDFDKRLADAEKRWDAAMAPYKGTKIVTYHRSWPNFAERFGLDVIGYVEPKPGIPPSPSHTLELMQEMKRQNVKIIAVEPYFDLRTPNAIARDTGAQVLVLAPSVGGVKEASNYIALFDYDVNLLVGAFKQIGTK
jgi:ABC-type Zn uptake system ZnuABC Zn-binding protein ZnuA